MNLAHKHELKYKNKNAPKAQIQKYKTALKLKQATKSRTISTTWNWWQLWMHMTWQNRIGFKNQNDSNQNNMNGLKHQEKLK